MGNSADERQVNTESFAPQAEAPHTERLANDAIRDSYRRELLRLCNAMEETNSGLSHESEPYKFIKEAVVLTKENIKKYQGTQFDAFMRGMTNVIREAGKLYKTESEKGAINERRLNRLMTLNGMERLFQKWEAGEANPDEDHREKLAEKMVQAELERQLKIPLTAKDARQILLEGNLSKFNSLVSAMENNESFKIAMNEIETGQDGQMLQSLLSAPNKDVLVAMKKVLGDRKPSPDRSVSQKKPEKQDTVKKSASGR